jgi:hypothetical protein
MMKKDSAEFAPVRKPLCSKELQDEIILYDDRTYKAHCLNSTAAAVWRLCDGSHSVAEIARAVVPGSESDPDAAKSLVWEALKQLGRSGVLVNSLPSDPKLSTLSRRELVLRLGAGTALAIPAARSALVAAAPQSVSPARQPSTRRRMPH